MGKSGKILFYGVLGILSVILIVLLIWTFSKKPSREEETAVRAERSETFSLELLSIEQFGSEEDDSPQGFAVDETGIYIAGETEGDLYGENAAGEDSESTPDAAYTRNDGLFNLDAPEDAFVGKFALDGKSILWSEQFGTSGYDSARGVAVNRSGVYVGGTTEGSLSQDLVGLSDLFLRKYSHEGELLWAKQWGTAKMDEGLWVTSEEDRVCIGGGTIGQLGSEPKNGDEDVFATCFDNEGNELWTVQFGSEKFEEALGGTLENGELYLVGATGGALEEGAKSKREDAFVAKISAEGNLEFVKQFGSSVTDFGHDVAVHDQSIYAVGRTEGSFGKAEAAGLSDAMLAALSTDGSEFLWSDQYGTPDGDTARAITVSDSGVFVVGVMKGKLEKHGPETSLEDGFIRHYNLGGKFLSETFFDSGGYDDPRDLIIRNGILYVLGQTSGELGEENYGAWDMFLMRYDIIN